MKMFTFYPWTGSHGLLAAKNENFPLYNGVKKLRFLDRRLYYRTFPGINSASEQQQTQKRHSNTQFTEFSSHAKNLGKQITHNVPLASFNECQTAGQFASQSMHRHYRVFSHDVTAAILVSQNNETAAMLVSQTSPLGVELFSYANALFCYNEFAYMLATWVKTLCKNMMKT